MPSHYHEEEYYGNEDAARIFKAPPKPWYKPWYKPKPKAKKTKKTTTTEE